jgi:semaphorin 5
MYRLSLEGLTKLEKATWPAKDSTIVLCTAKGQSEADCRNFVKILVSHKDRLFACGSNAFSPKCSWRDIESINHVTQWVDGRGKCPYSPRTNSSAFMNEGGEYYIASSTDFQSNDHAIYRMSGPNLNNDLLRTVQYNSLWLAQPNFVLTFETDRFIYFVFRENAIEYMNCGKTIYSRIARVCKNDHGGQLVLKDNWTTFLKARLNCSESGDYPFYYNEIQSAYYLSSESTVYATFTTPENSIAGSAICSFSLSNIENTFEGSFKKQAHSDSTWVAVNDIDHSHFECQKTTNNSEHLIPNSREYQLLDRAVQATNKGPLYKVTFLMTLLFLSAMSRKCF